MTGRGNAASAYKVAERRILKASQIAFGAFEARV
jgi:hypothetical protein